MKYEVKDKLTREASVLLENVDFHMLVSFPCWSNGERNLHETLLHNHVFYEFFLCKQGEICIKTSEEDILLRGGDITIIPPTKFHVLRNISENTEGYVMAFICKKLTGDHGVDVYKKLTPIIDNEIHIFNNCEDYIPGVHKIVDESLRGNAEGFLTALHFLEILLDLGKTKLKKRADAELKKSEAVSDDIERMMKLDSIISNRYLQRSTVEDYAKELFISTRQLDRIAIKRYGKSIYKLIVDSRFTLAEQLLATTELTIEDIALRVGFSSSASLYREFKRRKGMTPAMFRKSRKM